VLVIIGGGIAPQPPISPPAERARDRGVRCIFNKAAEHRVTPFPAGAGRERVFTDLFDPAGEFDVGYARPHARLISLSWLLTADLMAKLPAAVDDLPRPCVGHDGENIAGARDESVHGQTRRHSATWRSSSRMMSRSSI
jgi:hypothetical protein